MDNTDFLSIFIDEAEEQIQTLNAGLLALENEPENQELIREIARSAHTLKGGSKMMGFNEINQLAHKMEDLLIGVREGEFSLDPSGIDILFDGLDAIGSLVGNIDGESTKPVDVTALCERLENKTEYLKNPKSAVLSKSNVIQESETELGETADLSKSISEEPLQNYLLEIKNTIHNLQHTLLELEISNISKLSSDTCLDNIEILKYQIGSLESQYSIELDAISEVLVRLESTWWLISQESIELDSEIFDLILQGLGIIDLEIGELENGNSERWSDYDFCQLLEHKVPQIVEHLPAQISYEESKSNVETAQQNQTEQNTKIEIIPDTQSSDLIPQADAIPVSNDGVNQQLREIQQDEDTQKIATQVLSNSKKISGERIRVDVNQLNTIDSIVGEMLINRISSESHSTSFRNTVHNVKLQEKKIANLRSELNQIKFRFESVSGDFGNGSAIEKDLDDFVTDLNECGTMTLQIVEEISNLSASFSETLSGNNLVVERLQNVVKDMRLVPVSSVFSFFPRAVRDLEKELQKEINFVIQGEESRLDKTLVDQLKSPLLHLIRNAVDHGIEPPDIREKKDKDRKGKLILSAKEQADKIIICVEDDGSGIDTSKIKKKAVEKGVITTVEAGDMGDEEALYLICEPGFTTKSLVTDTSGRGVGMDVVRKEIESEMKGELKIESTIHLGTTFTLSLPLTLSDSQMCLVEAAGSYFAIPANSINTTETVNRKDIMSVANKLAIVIQGEIVPMVYLRDVLGIHQSLKKSQTDEIAVVVIEHGPQKIAFAVDAFRGVRLMVVKNLGNHLKRVSNIAGTSIMGNGEVAFILHIPDLIANTKDSKRSFSQLGNHQETKRSLQSTKKKILHVEDSMMIREMVRSILESAGYDVEVAVDGLDGLNKLKQETYDLVITDVEMPKMDGLELVKSYKSIEMLKNIPAIIVTTLSSEEEKQKGYEAGANRYIVKSEFDRKILLSGVESLIGLV